MRPDYCPIGGEPCQSMCDTPCKARKPLTDEQIEPLAASVIGYSALLPEEMKLFTDCVRAVEAAHGITKDTQ